MLCSLVNPFQIWICNTDAEWQEFSSASYKWAVWGASSCQHWFQLGLQNDQPVLGEGCVLKKKKSQNIMYVCKNTYMCMVIFYVMINVSSLISSSFGRKFDVSSLTMTMFQFSKQRFFLGDMFLLQNGSFSLEGCEDNRCSKATETHGQTQACFSNCHYQLYSLYSRKIRGQRSKLPKAICLISGRVKESALSCFILVQCSNFQIALPCQRNPC